MTNYIEIIGAILGITATILGFMFNSSKSTVVKNKNVLNVNSSNNKIKNINMGVIKNTRRNI
ncbi:MAG: hypothetical protein ACM3O3_12935 [Syntrophothermus sp.]